MFGAKVKLTAPKGLEIAKEAMEEVEKKFGAEVELSEKIDFANADAVYVCRVQQERFKDRKVAQKIKKEFTIKPEYLKGVKDGMIILHPLPKIDEIPPEVAKSPHARYFEQARAGVPMRMAIIQKMMENRGR
jgi:aspartate carbamoyltransferase catalytic subunit